MKKKRYKLSASLINAIMYYKAFPSKEKYEELKDTLAGVFVANAAMERGNYYEQAIYEGKIPKLSGLLKDLDYQTWGKPIIIEYPEFDIRVSSKADFLDKAKHIIYDVKRVDKFNPNRYKDYATCQHYMYFAAFPETKVFYYLVSEGEDEVTNTHVVKILRPSERVLDAKVKKYVDDTLLFIMRDNQLKEIYIKNQEMK